MTALSALLLVALSIWMIDIFWHKTAVAPTALTAFCYAGILLSIGVFVAKNHPPARDALLGAFAVFCIALAFKFIKRGFSLIGKKRRAKIHQHTKNNNDQN